MWSRNGRPLRVRDHRLQAAFRGGALRRIEDRVVIGASHSAAQPAGQDHGGSRQCGHDSAELLLHIFGTIRSSAAALTTKTAIQKAAVPVCP